MNKKITWCAALFGALAAVMVASPQPGVRRTGAPAPLLQKHTPDVASIKAVPGNGSVYGAPAPAATDPNVVYYIHPTEAEFNKCKVVNANNDDYKIVYGVVTDTNGKLFDWPIFYTNNRAAKLDADEWFITEGFTLDDIDNLYYLSVDVYGGVTTPESFQICIGKSDTPEAMTQVVMDEPSIKHPEYKTVSSSFGINEKGTYYLGIHITSSVNAFRMSFRDITVSRSSKSAGVPVAVSNLTATPDPTGANRATVEFNMPQLQINGKPLNVAQQLTANISSSVETVKAVGKPGEKISKVVNTVSGENVISVTVENGEGAGLEAKTNVMTSIDIPSEPVVTSQISADNMSVTLTWNPVTTGGTGGIVKPEDITYNIYKYIVQEDKSGWVAIANDLKECTYTFSVEDDVQDLHEFFVTAQNEVGETDGSLQCLARAKLGKLIELPMKEDFSTMVIKYGGYLVDSPAGMEGDYDAQWGFVTANKILEEAGSVGCMAAISQQAYATNGLLSLPKFATKGKEHLVADFRVWVDGLTAPTTIYAVLDNGKRVEIGKINPASNNSWVDYQFPIPAEVGNSAWAEMKLDASLPTYAYALMVSYFEVRELDKNDLSIESVTVGKAVINEPVDVTVVIRNRGSESKTLGKLTSAVYRRYFKVADLELDGKNQTLAGNESMTINGKFTVVHSDFADTRLTARVRIPAEDDNMDNNFAEVEFRLYGTGDPVISDLTGTPNSAGDGVALSWTHPDDLPPIESFESCDHGDFSGTIAQWNNVDFDGKATWTVQETYFPNGVEPKAFQAIDCSQIDNDNFVAHTGNYALFVWSAQEAQSDDWLISPEIDPSEGFSFWSQIIDGSFTEVMEVMASSTDREIDSFELVQTITQNTYGWKFNSVALPANTKYVALHYCSNDQFGMVIDDIFVKTSSKMYDVKGFNLYRNGEKVTRLTTNSFEDIHPDYSKNIYHVSVLASKNGEPEKEYARSNEFTLGESAIDGPAADSNITVTAGYGVLTVTGAQPATEVKVYAADGKLVASETAKATVNISLPAGVYMITVGEQVFKAAVR